MNNIDNIEGIVGNKENFIHKVGNCYLTKSEEEILNKYSINYKECKSNKELLLLIERYLEYNEENELEWLSDTLAERGYYFDTNK
jgi:hypothetical protein